MEIVVCGAGGNGDACCRFFSDLGIIESIVAICDNNGEKQGKMYEVSDGVNKQILSFEQAYEKYPRAIYWITPGGVSKTQILNQLIKAGISYDRIKYFTEHKDTMSRTLDYRHYYNDNHDGTYTFFIPLELCYTANIEDNPYHKTNWEYNYIYNAPIMKKVTLLNMYRMFMNGRAYTYNALIPEYERRLKSVKVSGIEFDYLSSLEKFAEHEYWHFQKMCECLAAGNMYFFISIAPYASFDRDKRVFNLSDGTHRAMLFYLMGIRYIPIKASKEDYNECFGEDKVGNVNDMYDICMKDELDELPQHAIPVGSFSLKFIYTPILHPEYYDIVVSRDSHFQSRVDILNEFFAYFSFEGKTMIDFGSNLSYVPHNFARQGADIQCIEYVKERADLGRALTSMYGLEKRVHINNISIFDYRTQHTFQIGIIFAILDHWSTKINGDGAEFLQKVDSLVDDMLIWESGNMPEREKEYIKKYTKFKSYHFVSYTYGTGKCRELGIFTRSGYEPKFN